MSFVLDLNVFITPKFFVYHVDILSKVHLVIRFSLLVLRNRLYSVYAGCSLLFPFLFFYLLCSLRYEVIKSRVIHLSLIILLAGIIIFFCQEPLFIILFKVLIKDSYASFVFTF